MKPSGRRVPSPVTIASLETNGTAAFCVAAFERLARGLDVVYEHMTRSRRTIMGLPGKRGRSVLMLVKDELLDKVAARIGEQMPGEQAPQVEEFARQYYGWVDTEDLEDRSPVDAYGAALSHWSFAGRREPGERKIRIYNPHFEEHGWQSTHTVIEMVNDDMPFLVDSTRMEINRQGYAIHMILHPVMNVRRDEEGRLLEVLPPDADEEDAISESVIHVEVDRQTKTLVLEDLKQAIQKTLADVKAAVEHW